MAFREGGHLSGCVKVMRFLKARFMSSPFCGRKLKNVNSTSWRIHSKSEGCVELAVIVLPLTVGAHVVVVLLSAAVVAVGHGERSALARLAHRVVVLDAVTNAAARLWVDVACNHVV